MHAAAQDGTKDDPQVHTGTPAGTGQGAEDGTQTGDVQQLNEEQPPGLHGGVVHAVGVGHSRGLAIIHTEDLLDELAVQGKTHDQDNQRDQERNHNVFPPTIAAPPAPPGGAKKLACGAAAPQWHHLDLAKHCAAPFHREGGQGGGGLYRPPPKRLYYSTKGREVKPIFGGSDS